MSVQAGCAGPVPWAPSSRMLPALQVQQEGNEAGQASSLTAMLCPSPPSLINLAKNSGELQRSLEQVITTYKTE